MTESDPTIDVLLAEYMQRVDSGQPVDREEFLLQHSEHADELRDLLEAGDEIERLVSPAAVETPSPGQLPTGKFSADSAADIYQEETWHPGASGKASDTSPNSVAPASSPTEERQRFGDYELLEEIARGGMGVVFKARQIKLNRLVALKMILAGQLASQEQVARFYVEAQAAAALRHPNIVPVYDVGEQDGQHYLSMGYVDGPSLADRIAKGPLPPRSAAHLVRKLAIAMGVAHKKGVIHRDLKPANILLEEDGSPRITDFGLAKQTNSNNNLTATGLIFGTPSYMAPEQAAGETAEIGPLADVYSLGAILYCCLTGRPPFEAANVVKTIQQVMQEEPESVRTLNPKVPQKLETICLKCLEKDPQKRYASADELAAALKRFLLKSKQKPSESQHRSTENPVESTTQRKALTIGIAAAAAVLLPLIVWAVTLFFRVGEVDIKVMIDDPSLSVRFDGQTVTFEGSGEPIKLTPGKHGFVVERNGLKAMTDEFTVDKDGKCVLRVAMVDGKVAVVPPDYRADPRKDATPPLTVVRSDTANDEKITELSRFEEHSGPITAIALAPNGKFVVSKGNDTDRSKSEVRVWNPATGKQIRAFAAASVLSLAVSPDSRNVAIGEFGGKISLYDTSSGEVQLIFDGHSGKVTAIEFSPDGTQLLSQAADGSARVWDVKTGKELARTDFGSHGGSVDFSPDGKTALINGLGEGVYLWDLNSPKMRPVIPGRAWTYFDVEFSPDGRQALGMVSGGIVLIDIETAREIRRFDAGSSPVAAIEFLPNGRSFVSGSYDGTLRVWDVETGRELARANNTNHVTLKLQVSPDGRLAVSGGGSHTEGAKKYQGDGDYAIRVWQLPKSVWPKTELGAADAPPPAVAPFNEQQAKAHQQAWADHLRVPVEKEIDLGDGVKLNMVLIPPGEFMMGSSEAVQSRLLKEAKAKKNEVWIKQIHSEFPQHRVLLTRPFRLSRYEVTRGQFRQFVKDAGYKTDGERDGKGGVAWVRDKFVRDPRFIWSADLGFSQTDDHPVVCVSWNDANAFCQWLSKKQGVTFHLPTEAQWEYTCRAGSTTAWHFGDGETALQEYAWYSKNSDLKTHPVGRLRPNGFGLYDMHGNVFEWCADWYGADYFGESPLSDPIGPLTGSHRMDRGGGWRWYAKLSRSASREGTSPGDSFATLGFRLASVVDESPKAAKLPTPAQPGNAPPPAVAPFNAAKAKKHQQAWADHLGVPVETTNSIGMKFRVIPPGEFLMGSSEKEIAKLLEEAKEQMLPGWYIQRIPSEGPQHKVTLTKTFGMSIHEVTRGQFSRFVAATDYKTDAEKDGKGGVGYTFQDKWHHDSKFLWNTKLGFTTEQTDNDPVQNVTWNDAVAFCEWLSEKEKVTYRLPTEAEWEFACRAGSLARYSFGDEESLLELYAWYGEINGRNTNPVGQKRSNGFGLFDLHGNSCEWCLDRYNSYTPAPTVDPRGSSQDSLRVIRGGSFAYSSSAVRCAYRTQAQSNENLFSVGFRVVKTYDRPVQSPNPKPQANAGNEPPPAIAPFNQQQAKAHQQAWADHLGVPVETTNSIGMKFRVIPPGEFLMGSSEEEIEQLTNEAREGRSEYWCIKRIPDEGPQHRVTLTKPFGMSNHEVTRGLFRQFVDATGYKTDAEQDGKGGYGYKEDKWVQAPGFLWNTNVGFDKPQTDEHPVVNVSWNDAVAFCNWLSTKENVTYRLPTEAQREFACRAGSLGRFSCGDEESLLEGCVWFGNRGGRNTKPVGQKRPNSFGLFDLHGSVWEWCQDWYGIYTTTVADPVGPSQGSERVLRGGAFSNSLLAVRSAFRSYKGPTMRDSSVGFRPVRIFEETKPKKTKPKTTHIWPKVQPAPAIAPFGAAKAKAHQQAWADQPIVAPIPTTEQRTSEQ